MTRHLAIDYAKLENGMLSSIAMFEAMCQRDIQVVDLSTHRVACLVQQDITASAIPLHSVWQYLPEADQPYD